MKSKHTYHTEAPKSKLVEYSQETNIDVKIQVIVCGQHASHFLAGINDGDLEFNEEENYPAFIYSSKGHANTIAKFNLDLTVDYTETHKKKTNPIIEYKHESHITDHSQCQRIIHHTFQTTIADFKSSNHTWIILAGADKKEQEVLLNNITKLISHNRFKLYELMLGKQSLAINVEQFPVSHVHHISNIREIKKAAVTFEKTLKDDVEKVLITQEKELINTLKVNAEKEMEQEIHQDANKYFQEENEEKCLIM